MLLEHFKTIYLDSLRQILLGSKTIVCIFLFEHVSFNKPARKLQILITKLIILNLCVLNY